MNIYKDSKCSFSMSINHNKNIICEHCKKNIAIVEINYFDDNSNFKRFFCAKCFDKVVYCANKPTIKQLYRNDGIE